MSSSSHRRVRSFARHHLPLIALMQVLFLSVPSTSVAAVKVHEQLPYLGDGRDEYITVHVPDGAGPFPLVLCVPGGGLGECRMGKPNQTAAWLAANGYVGAAFTYHCPGTYTEGERLDHANGASALPQAIWDYKTAIRYMRANAATFKVDPDKIGAIGFSAGAWLTSRVAYSNDSTVVKGSTGKGKDKRAISIPYSHDAMLYAEQGYQLQAIICSSGLQSKTFKLRSEGDPLPPLLAFCGQNEWKSGKSGQEFMQVYEQAGVEAIIHPCVKGGHAPCPASNKGKRSSEQLQLPDGAKPLDEEVLAFLARHLR